MSQPLIWVDGIIGVGKSTTVTKLGQSLNFHIFPEPVNEDLLKIYYQDQSRWGFAFQMNMLNQRFYLYLEAVKQVSNGRGVIMDRCLPGDRVFAQMLHQSHKIHDVEWAIYENSYNSFINYLPPPNLLIFLETTPLNAFRRIKKRSREAENSNFLPLEYLENLYQEYQRFLKQILSGNHPWSSKMEVWVLDWNKDWLPLEPIVTEIQELFCGENRVKSALIPQNKDSIISNLSN